MKVAVWDTYVVKKNGETMHFDIIAPDHIKDESLIHKMGKEYLFTKNQQGQTISSKECQFCHQESASPEMVYGIEDKGFYIIEMEGCD